MDAASVKLTLAVSRSRPLALAQLDELWIKDARGKYTILTTGNYAEKIDTKLAKNQLWAPKSSEFELQGTR